jgi:hypothetical protein
LDKDALESRRGCGHKEAKGGGKEVGESIIGKRLKRSARKVEKERKEGRKEERREEKRVGERRGKRRERV